MLNTNFCYFIIFIKPPVIFCHPIANCFHRSPLYNDIGKDESEKELNTETTKESGEHSDEFNIDENSSENVPSTPERAHFSNDASVKTPDRDIKSMNSYGDMFISTFFIGLSFQQGVKFADVTFSINVIFITHSIFFDIYFILFIY